MNDKVSEEKEDGGVFEDLNAAFEAALAAQQQDAPSEEAESAKEPAKNEGETEETPENAGDSGDSESAKKPAEPTERAPKDYDPPARWSKEEKEAWLSMADGLEGDAAEKVRTAQRALITHNRKIESEYGQRFQELASARSYKAEMDQLLEPSRQQWRAAGLSDTAALQQLIAGFDYSVRDFPGFLKWVAAQRGYDLNQLIAGEQSSQQRPPSASELQRALEADGMELHPAVLGVLQNLEQRNVDLERQLQAQAQGVHQLSSQWQQQSASQSQALAQEVDGELKNFATAVDDAGQPKYPFFNDVRYEMGQLIASGMAQSLQDAYDRAVYANPRTRAQVTEMQEIRVRREVERKMQDEAKRARRAAGGIASGSPAIAPTAGDQMESDGSIMSDIDAAIAAQIRRNSGRL